MKRYLIEGCCDGGLFAETVDAESQEQAEALALERLKEVWREPDAESLDDLGDCATVREYSPDEYARDAGPELLDILQQLMPGISLEVECRKHGGNDEDWHELERLEGLAYAAIAKATGTATAA